MIRPGLAIAGAVLVVTLCIAVIPVPKPAPDFSRDAPASAPAQGTVASASGAAAAFRETRWSELVPENWDPDQTVRELQQGMQLLADTDPRAMERLKKIRDVWDDAPTNKRLDGTAVRIPGYIVPLEEANGGIEEFLLVPYFGACIHYAAGRIIPNRAPHRRHRAACGRCCSA